MPGFAVFFQAHAFGLAVGVEAEHGLGRADFYGDDVPDVEGDDVGGDEVAVLLGRCCRRGFYFLGRDSGGTRPARR